MKLSIKEVKPIDVENLKYDQPYLVKFKYGTSVRVIMDIAHEAEGNFYFDDYKRKCVVFLDEVIELYEIHGVT